MEQHFDKGAGEMEDPRENPPTSGSVPRKKIPETPRQETNPVRLGGKRASVAKRLACSLPTKAIRVQSLEEPLWISDSENRAGRCRCSGVFLGDLPFSPPFRSNAAPRPPQSPSSALKTSLDDSVKPDIRLIGFRLIGCRLNDTLLYCERHSAREVDNVLYSGASHVGVVAQGCENCSCAEHTTVISGAGSRSSRPNASMRGGGARGERESPPTSRRERSLTMESPRCRTLGSRPRRAHFSIDVKRLDDAHVIVDRTYHVKCDTTSQPTKPHMSGATMGLGGTVNGDKRAEAVTCGGVGASEWPNMDGTLSTDAPLTVRAIHDVLQSKIGTLYINKRLRKNHTHCDSEC
ncbi:hypothetical protein PR048_001281 [Dryococelus australis]|uniref:Uncharacterized protein n=1 Tax=Dryococelus australis TaxID=614101 RepID=A0ABQ9IGY2_9NEOP|nr:hypothetical protein PR048_001281 [Dryococelus australis]